MTVPVLDKAPAKRDSNWNFESRLSAALILVVVLGAASASYIVGTKIYAPYADLENCVSAERWWHVDPPENMIWHCTNRTVAGRVLPPPGF